MVAGYCSLCRVESCGGSPFTEGRLIFRPGFCRSMHRADWAVGGAKHTQRWRCCRFRWSVRNTSTGVEGRDPAGHCRHRVSQDEDIQLLFSVWGQEFDHIRAKVLQIGFKKWRKTKKIRTTQHSGTVGEIRSEKIDQTCFITVTDRWMLRFHR